MILPLALAAAVLADGAKDLELTVQSSSLFKNGFAIVVREAKIPASGDYYIRDIPQAGLGTFWVMTSPGTHLEMLRNEPNETSTERFAGSLDEIVALNKDKVLEITYYGNQTPIKAKILSTDGQVILFKVGEEFRAITKGAIQSIRSADQLIYKTRDVVTSRVLHMQVVAGADARVRFMSLEKGLSWTPAYYLDITDPKMLTLVAKCTLSDDLTNLNDTPVRLVTGFPNFQHATALDPMSLFQTIYQATGNFMNQQAGNGVFSNAQFAAPEPALREEVKSIADAFAGGAVPGGGNEDLFYYDLPHVSIKKSERAYQPLFDAKASYEHVYRLSIDEGRTAETNLNQNRPPLEVWHTLEFTNPMSQPLTTASAMVISKGDVLGQSTIDYTPTSSKVHLYLTKALDVPAEIHEEEVSRVRTQIVGRSVDEVVVKGRIRIENRKPTAIHLEIAKSLVGEVREIGDPGRAEKSTQGLAEINPRSTLHWDTKVEGYKTLDLSYSYMVRI